MYIGGDRGSCVNRWRERERAGRWESGFCLF